jgi:hypothetical protein
MNCRLWSREISNCKMSGEPSKLSWPVGDIASDDIGELPIRTKINFQREREVVPCEHKGLRVLLLLDELKDPDP